MRLPAGRKEQAGRLAGSNPGVSFLLQAIPRSVEAALLERLAWFLVSIDDFSALLCPAPFQSADSPLVSLHPIDSLSTLFSSASDGPCSAQQRPLEST